MPAITSVRGRVIFDSRGADTIEVEVDSGGRTGRACAPAGASVGRHEAAAFAPGGPAQSLSRLLGAAPSITGADAGDPAAVRAALRTADGTPRYEVVGGAAAFALSMAAAESAALADGVPLFESLGEGPFYIPYPLGNVLGGGAHAGPGAPDIQEVLVCATGMGDARSAACANASVHRELGRVLAEKDPGFTGGKGDEGGWAPSLGNEEALECAARACERLGFTLGREVSLGVDFAASTQWDGKAYDYARAGRSHDPGEQVEFAAGLISRFKLAYAEDPVHEDDFEGMAELTRRFPDVMVTGDDLTATNTGILGRAASSGSCNAAILKVNQAGCLADALEFAALARDSGIRLATSHRSGDTTDPHIAHVGIATGSRMLKAGVVGGERIAKVNELLRLEGHGLIRGMAGA
ncbi:MAG: enolase [Nitrosopumilus sp.]|nr:enolase [Nitrosopumilus sp.]